MSPEYVGPTRPHHSSLPSADRLNDRESVCCPSPNRRFEVGVLGAPLRVDFYWSIARADESSLRCAAPATRPATGSSRADTLCRRTLLWRPSSGSSRPDRADDRPTRLRRRAQPRDARGRQLVPNGSGRSPMTRVHTVEVTVVSARGLVKRFGRGRASRVALDGADLEVAPGEVVAVLGRSGSGKSTLRGSA